jgi:hypothetical protein
MKAPSARKFHFSEADPTLFQDAGAHLVAKYDRRFAELTLVAHPPPTESRPAPCWARRSRKRIGAATRAAPAPAIPKLQSALVTEYEYPR